MRKAILLFCLIASVTSYSQSVSFTIDNFIESYTNTNDFSGCVSVVEGDTIKFQDCYGYASLTHRIKNDRTTKFKVGSISKQFTAGAILLLEQKGMLAITDSLQKYFPGKSRVKSVTIHQLLSHTSGITDIFNIPDFGSLSCQNISSSDLVALLLDEELLFTPGSQYQYSNGGYAVLAEIIEKISGIEFSDFLDQNIFQPLNMMASGCLTKVGIVQNLATGYDPLGYNDLIISSYIDDELLKGSGSVYSTIDDLLLWIQSLRDQNLFSKDSYKKLFNNYGNNYGYGISVYTSNGKQVFGHDGRISGFIADYLYYVEDDMSVIIMGNVQTGVADFFRGDIASILFGKEYSLNSRTDSKGADEYPNDINDILGTYAFGPSFKVYVEMINGRLQARANEGSYSELIPLQSGKFFNRTLFATIKFSEDDSGIIKKMIWTNNEGNSFEGSRQ